MLIGAAAAAAWMAGLAFTSPGQVRTPSTTNSASGAGVKFGNMRGAGAEASSTSASALALGGICVAAALTRGSKSVRKALSQDELKKMVGYKAVDDYVQSGTVIGLGTGSTAAFAVERVGEKLKSGD